MPDWLKVPSFSQSTEEQESLTSVPKENTIESPINNSVSSEIPDWLKVNSLSSEEEKISQEISSEIPKVEEDISQVSPEKVPETTIPSWLVDSVKLEDLPSSPPQENSAV